MESHKIPWFQTTNQMMIYWKGSPEVPALYFFGKNQDPCEKPPKPGIGDVSRSARRCIKTLAPQIGNPNCATKILMNIFGG
jgi:hypothetical protein